MYLLPSSCHFHTVSKNIPYGGVALRLRRICSTETEFNMKSGEYQKYLIARGHSEKRVRKQFHKASLISREVAYIYIYIIKEPTQLWFWSFSKQIQRMFSCT